MLQFLPGMNYPILTDVLVALTFILCAYLCWFYLKLARQFKNFPTYPFGKLGLRILIGLKDASLTTVILNELRIVMERFQDEDLFVFWFFRPIVVILKEECVKMLLNDPGNLNKPIFYKMVSEFTGKGLLTHNGSTWKNRRKLLDPAFRLKMLKDKMNAINHIAKDLVSQISEMTSDNSGIEISHLLQIATFKTICEFALGLNTSNKKYDKTFIETAKTFQCLETYTVQRFTRPWLYLKSFQLFFEEGRQHRKLYDELRTFTKFVITEVTNSNSKRTSEDGRSEKIECNNKTANDILTEHLSKDSSFVMQDFENEVQTLLLTGHNPAALELLWSLFLLGLHPDAQEKAFEEVQVVAGASDNDINYTDSNQLEYLESIIKETLRIYPAVSVLARETSREVECGKYRIPKNTCIVFSSYLLQRNPNIYPDPEKFDPMRFYGDNPKHPWTYIPFSGGYRSCIGKNLAMLEMKVFLAHILKNFKITSLDTREDIGIDWTITLKPAKPIRLKFARRQ